MNILKGWFGEKKASFYMWLSLDKNAYTRFHDVIIQASNGTTQIDHILVSQFGIFIVETKNKNGWIFGSEAQAKWTISYFGKKFSFQNPLRQAYRQKKVLAQFLDIDESNIKTIIYFVGKCKFKTQLPSNVLKSGLGRYISKFTEPILTQGEVSTINETLEQHKRECNLSTRDHVKSLKKRHSSSTICPRCGSSLIIKTARKGRNAGEQFLGCESYPQCRFTKSA